MSVAEVIELPIAHAVDLEPQSQTIQTPKYLKSLSEGAKLSEIFVYSEREFAIATHDSPEETFPSCDDFNLVDLGGEFTVGQVRAALKSMTENEDPEITHLREHIVEVLQNSNMLSYDVDSQILSEAGEKGIVTKGDFKGQYYALGVMAYDPAEPGF